ncbi:MAG: hypothetical protein JWP74_1931 [Marmoricola sp.]|nr:hypothetical protein [Marmoricola sp.]
MVASVAFPARLVQVDGWSVALRWITGLVVVVVLVLGFALRRDARAIARVQQATPGAWVRVAAVYGLRQDVVMAVLRDRIAVIGYDGAEVATWDRSEMASVEPVTIPSSWPARPGVLIRFHSTSVPSVLVAFTNHLGAWAPAPWAAEAVRLLDPGAIWSG